MLLQTPTVSASTAPFINFLDAINLLLEKFEGRVLVSSRFTPEDQVLTHFIFKNNLAARVYTLAPDNHYDILCRTVEHYGKNIEVLYHQTLLANAAFAEAFPEQYEQLNINPLTAPISQILAGKHVIVSGLRREQFADQASARPFHWDETQRKFRYYPLFYWTAAEVNNFILEHSIPHATGSLHPAGAAAGFSGVRRPSVINSIYQTLRAFRAHIFSGQNRQSSAWNNLLLKTGATA